MKYKIVDNYHLLSLSAKFIDSLGTKFFRFSSLSLSSGESIKSFILDVISLSELL